MGLIDLPSLRDFIESVDWVIPSDQRGFSTQTSEPHYSTRDWAIGAQHSQVPVDYHTAEDGDPFIKQVQTTMKNPPKSWGLSFFTYKGPIDGKKSGKWYEHLRNVLIQFGWALKKKFPNKKIPVIVSGKSISKGGFNAAVAMAGGKTVEKKEEEKDEKVTKEVKSATVKAFQSFFSKHQPIIGQLYGGEVDGKMNKELVAAAKSAEGAIAKVVGPAVHGKLITFDPDSPEGGQFNTSVFDLDSALSLIQKHKDKGKVAFIDSKCRILLLSSIISE